MNTSPENPEPLRENEAPLAPPLVVTPSDIANVSSPAPDPVWDGWDVFVLVILTFAAMFVSLLAALGIARHWIYPRLPVAEIAKMPLLVVGSQAFAYVLVLGYMVAMVKVQKRQPNFLTAIHWNWPRTAVLYLFAGFVLSLGLQMFAHVLPIPKNLPIDTFFSTPAEAWVLTIFGISLAPLMEELFFRGFLFPVLRRAAGNIAAIVLTAIAFALLHGGQLKFSWAPVLIIFLVGLVLTIVRAKTNSVSAGLLMHMAYNGTISILLLVATGGFRHLERLGNQ